MWRHPRNLDVVPHFDGRLRVLQRGQERVRSSIRFYDEFDGERNLNDLFPLSIQRALAPHQIPNFGIRLDHVARPPPGSGAAVIRSLSTLFLLPLHVLRQPAEVGLALRVVLRELIIRVHSHDVVVRHRLIPPIIRHNPLVRVHSSDAVVRLHRSWISTMMSARAGVRLAARVVADVVGVSLRRRLQVRAAAVRRRRVSALCVARHRSAVGARRAQRRPAVRHGSGAAGVLEGGGAAGGHGARGHAGRVGVRRVLQHRSRRRGLEKFSLISNQRSFRPPVSSNLRIHAVRAVHRRRMVRRRRRAAPARLTHVAEALRLLK